MRTVVGVAIRHEGRVLAARRPAGSSGAGHWELPGGKVEDGEDDAAAAVREIAEELGCTIEVTGWLDGEQPVGGPGDGLVLRIATATLAVGDPVPHEHDAVRWLEPRDLLGLAWLPSDVTFVTQLSRDPEVP